MPAPGSASGQMKAPHWAKHAAAIAPRISFHSFQPFSAVSKARFSAPSGAGPGTVRRTTGLQEEEEEEEERRRRFIRIQ